METASGPESGFRSRCPGSGRVHNAGARTPGGRQQIDHPGDAPWQDPATEVVHVLDSRSLVRPRLASRLPELHWRGPRVPRRRSGGLLPLRRLRRWDLPGDDGYRAGRDAGQHRLRGRQFSGIAAWRVVALRDRPVLRRVRGLCVRAGRHAVRALPVHPVIVGLQRRLRHLREQSLLPGLQGQHGRQPRRLLADHRRQRNPPAEHRRRLQRDLVLRRRAVHGYLAPRDRDVRRLDRRAVPGRGGRWLGVPGPRHRLQQRSVRRRRHPQSALRPLRVSGGGRSLRLGDGSHRCGRAVRLVRRRRRRRVQPRRRLRPRRPRHQSGRRRGLRWRGRRLRRRRGRGVRRGRGRVGRLLRHRGMRRNGQRRGWRRGRGVRCGRGRYRRLLRCRGVRRGGQRRGWRCRRGVRR